MKYCMSQLTKQEIEEIVKKIYCDFVGLYCYAPSHKNKMLKVIKPTDNNIIELFDSEKKIHDKWGEYNKMTNTLYVQAWDEPCFWPVGIYLYDDHFEIPKYREGFIKLETQANFEKYRINLKNLFDKKRNLGQEYSL